MTPRLDDSGGRPQAAAPAPAATKSSMRGQKLLLGGEPESELPPTFLLPLARKVGTGKVASASSSVAPGTKPSQAASLVKPLQGSALPSPGQPDTGSREPIVEPAATAALPAPGSGDSPQRVDKPGLPVPLPALSAMSGSQDVVDLESEGTGAIDENTLLKGTVQIVADDTEYDQSRNTFLGTGNAVATIAGEDSRLEADMILYDQNSQVIDARGSVKILRQGQLSTGSSFKFKVNSDEYLITNPDTEVQGTQVVARSGYGNKKGLGFKQGTLSLPQPFYLARNPYVGTIQSAEEGFYKTIHPDAYVPAKPSFTFKARKMVYEKYKESGNLTIFGGKLAFGNFTVPLGKLTATVGQESRVTMPVTPVISNNLQVGGINIGPSFNSAIGKSGAFSWAPLLQIGGRQANGDSDSGRLGAGVRIAYSGKRMSANLAYGSVSNLLVGDLRYWFNEKTHFQGGINRFMPDGLFGSRRARLLAEFVDMRGMGGIPFLQGIAFRSSAGWAQDQPSLVNLTPDYAKLFTQTSGNIVSAYRLQEQIMASTEPIFSIGDKKYGAQMNIFGGLAGRAYSSGDSMLMGQIGPVLNVNLNRMRLQGQLMKSGVKGQSPFVFDQFIQGNKSAAVGADIKISKWLTVGGNLGYNIDSKLLYQRSISAAIGPEDFKVLLTRDTIRGINRFGFDVLYGQPIPFDKLVLKGSPDHGQLGGM